MNIEKDRILVVEDELSLQETLSYNLKKQEYEVETVGEGNAAILAAHRFVPDLILLDVMLPGIDGFEVCRILRQDMNVPIIFLTARDDEIDRVIGLEIGGDDYIIKPFSMREVLARVKGRLRMTRKIREQFEAAKEIKEVPVKTKMYGNLRIDENRREIFLSGKSLSFKPKEYELLLFFTQHQGRLISRDYILHNVWGYTYTGDSRTVDVHVRWLREKIEPDPSDPNRIITVRGGGYRFEG
jgi:DNA-binding response OmpR family regulator